MTAELLLNALSGGSAGVDATGTGFAVSRMKALKTSSTATSTPFTE